MANIDFEIKAENIGPHEKLNAKQKDNSSVKLGVFANNGSGKTFLSRAFRLATSEKFDKKEKSNKLISFNASSASFIFKVQEKNKPDKELNIRLKRNEDPLITNSTGYIFHVFNSDYVSENLEASKYRPDGRIEGYILGKEKIDISKEKEALEKTNERIAAISDKIKDSVTKAVAELDKCKISKNTKEYRELNLDNFLDPTFLIDENKSFKELLQQHKKFLSIPDELEDIDPIKFGVDYSFFDELKDVLITCYDKSHFDEEFKKTVLENQDFIKAGLEALKSVLERNECPFCKQELRESEISLLENYKKLFENSEGKVNTKINSLKIKLQKAQKATEELSHRFFKTKEKFDEYKNYLPTWQERSFGKIPDIKSVEQEFDQVFKCLDSKQINISEAIIESDFSSSIESIRSFFINILECIKSNNTLIEGINKSKNNLGAERLSLNKKLCRARLKKLKHDESQTWQDLAIAKTNADLLTSDIKEKESQHKASKKGKVVKAFTELLNNFFRDKYTFDEEDFCLKFKKTKLSNNASDVLSDGEKSIVAFCYYLATTHTLIENDDDYTQLFFVIDDPISSLDFHYVYAVAQIFRTLDVRFSIPPSKVRYLLFTHNLEFMSILIRNGIIMDNHFILSNGQLGKLNKQLIMPYEGHLHDVYHVAKGGKANHTIPNSIRHILETVNRFEHPNLNLKDYYSKHFDTRGNDFLFSLMHDGSHGVIRNQYGYTDEMIKNGCLSVIEFLREKFEGQIIQIEKVTT